MPQPAVEKPESQLLSWLALIIGGLFLIPTLPFTLLLVFMPIWKPDETSFLSIFFTAISVGICAVTIWAMRRAYKVVRQSPLPGTEQDPTSIERRPHQKAKIDQHATKKPVWPWVVIAPSVLLLFAAGPGAMMLPIMPVYLAAMSTDSGTVPDYVPALIFIIGYALIIGYVVLLVKAVKALRSK